MLALRLKIEGKLEPASHELEERVDSAHLWNAERLAHECSRVVRWAKSHTGLAVKACNMQTTMRDDTRKANLRICISNEIERLIPPSKRPGMKMGFHGDPRGGRTVTIEWDRLTEWSIG